jgi:hypothetical protein
VLNQLNASALAESAASGEGEVHLALENAISTVSSGASSPSSSGETPPAKDTADDAAEAAEAAEAEEAAEEAEVEEEADEEGEEAAEAAEEAEMAVVEDLPSGADPLYGGAGSAARVWLDAAVGAVAEEEAEGGAAEAEAEAVEAEAEAVEAEELAALELQVWLELDALLTAVTAARPRPPSAPPPAPLAVPQQLLGLMPPPPAGGWSEDCALAAAAAGCKARSESELKTKPVTLKGEGGGDQGGGDEQPDDEPDAAGRVDQHYVPVAPAYPARKRAERFSWAIWAVIGDQKVGVNAFGGSPYQPLLEADGTAERLRAARLKLREYTESV